MSTLQSYHSGRNMSDSNREYDPLEEPLYVHAPIGLAITAVLLDRGVALLFWVYESNPLVEQLGVYNWLLVTFILIAGMGYAWYPAMGFKNDLVRALVYGIGIGHTAMVLMNLAVVFL